MQPRDHHHHEHNDCNESERPHGPLAPNGITHRTQRNQCSVLAVRLRDPEPRWNLLEEDDHGDPEGEPLDDRPRDVGEVAPETEDAGKNHRDASEQTDQ